MAERVDVVRALCSVQGVESETIKAVAVNDGQVRVTLALAADDQRRAAVRQAAAAAVAALDGVADVEVHLVADRPAPPAERASAAGGTEPIDLPDIADIVAVGAGKGGVGKSTVAMHLAVGLAQAGKRVGLLDADVYGPSLAMMAGIEGQPPQTAPDGRILPFAAGPLKVVSVANFVEPGSAMIWRGPMVHATVRQLLGDVAWGPLDVLIVDLPPGTGDVPLTLAQSAAVTGAVLVSTPQPVALADAMRAAEMYRSLGISVLGFVENMSYFACGECGTEHDLFGRGGVARLAEGHGYACLAQLPMHGEVRARTDAAEAEANFAGDGPVAEALARMVTGLFEAIDRRRSQGPAPQPLGVRPG